MLTGVFLVAVSVLAMTTCGVNGCIFMEEEGESGISTTTYTPTDEESRLYQELRMTVIKDKLLKGLGIEKPPEIPEGAAAILMNDVKRLPLPNYLAPKHTSNAGTALLAGSGRKYSRVIIFAEIGSNSPCKVHKSILRNYTPVSFKLPNSPSLIRRAILQYKSAERRSFHHEESAWVCSCRTASYENGTTVPEPRNAINKIDPMSEFKMTNAGCIRLSLSTNASNADAPTFTRKGWSHIRLTGDWKSLVSGLYGAGKRLLFLLDGKMSITERKRPSLVLEVEKEVPKLRMKRDEANGKTDNDCAGVPKNGVSNECCRLGFWVDIKQIGWDNWILSPSGFYYHVCTGRCKTGFDSILKDGVGLDYSKVMNAFIEKNKIKDIRPCCVPRKTSHLSITIATGGTSINRTQIPNFIVDQCACIGFS